MKKQIALFLILTGIFAGVISCSKDEHTSTPPTPIFTLNFTDKFIPAQIPVIVFLSRPDGSTIMDTTCTSNITYVFYPPSGKYIPEKFIVTIVHSEIFWHNLMAHINSYTNVSKGSEWTLKGTKPDTIGKATVSLTNLPDLAGPVLYSTSGYSNETSNTSGVSAILYQSPDDLYVKINTPDGHFYKLTEIVRNGNFSVDMSDPDQTATKSVSFPFSAENYEVQLYGYVNSDYDSPLPVMADHVMSDGIPVSSASLHYPASYFSGFHTKMMLQETFTSSETWFCQTEGVIPDQFAKIDAGIISMLPQTGSVTIQTNGTFNMTGAHWQFVDQSLLYYEWQIYASDTTSTFVIPEIPPDFKKMFPTISRDSLIFQYAELTDFATVNSYEELIGYLFNPSYPQQMDRFNASVIRKNFYPWNIK